MRTLIFIFCLFWSLSVIGQGNWYVGASATPYSYWLYNSDAMASDRVSYQTNLFGVNGFQGQLMIGRRLNDNLSLESGLTYCWQVQRFGKSEPESNSIEFSFHQTQYIGIPLSLSLTLLKEEVIQPWFRVGFQARYLLDYYQRRELHSEGGSFAGITKWSQDEVVTDVWLPDGYEFSEFDSNGALQEFVFGSHLGLGFCIAGDQVDFSIGLLGNWDWTEVLNTDHRIDNRATPENENYDSNFANWRDFDARTTHIWVGLEVGVRYYW
jgi:hypothetical protein